MEKKLGDAYPLISRMIRSVDDEVYKKDIAVLRGNQFLEPKQSIYLIFREVCEKSNMPSTLYVGKTKQSVSKRFKQHISNIKSMDLGNKAWTAKYKWMQQVILNGGTLSIIELSKVQKSKVYYYEQRWIDYLKKVGFNTLNKVNTKYYNTKILKI
jgi:hypothetical protein